MLHALLTALLSPCLVSAFSKKTGDYGVLSPTDVKVLALTYELECQLGVESGENLRTDPLQQVMMQASGLLGLCDVVVLFMELNFSR